MKQELTIQDIQTRIRHLPNRMPFLLTQDLAMIFETEVKHINQAVKRNSKRFPEDFLFQLNKEEVKILKSQNVTLHSPRANPYGFYREGANMLSNVLHTTIAIDRSIQIIRAFSLVESRYSEVSESSSTSNREILRKLEDCLIETQKMSHQILLLAQDFQKINERMSILENQMEAVMKVKGSFNENHWFFGKFTEIMLEGIDLNREEINKLKLQFGKILKSSENVAVRRKRK